MRPMLCGAVMAAALAGAAAAPAGAHEALRVGQTVTGSLAQNDPALSERGRFKVYRFDARRGQRFIVTLKSTDFDAYLTVARSVGGVTDQLKTDDDRGGGTDARLRFTAPEDGQYLLIAQSLAEEGVGGFNLQLETAPEPTTGQAREIRVGQTVSGSLAETDAVLDDDSFYDTWTVSAGQGQRLLIELKADSFDTFLSVGKLEGGEFNALQTDDDGGEGTNSRVRLTLDEGGEYIIRANSLGAGLTGTYTLSVTERPAAAAAATPRPITAGQDVAGSLEDTDAAMDDESFYDYWTFQGRAGEKIRITMKSEDFDTFLAFGRLNGAEFTEIASNDDGGDDGTNSQVEVTLPENGTYVIRTNSLSGGNTGAYTVRVDRM
jgi:opacity protein-like surface antigen